MIKLFLVYESGALAKLTEMTEEQAASLVQTYQSMHIFYTTNGDT